jgi:[CysO sulfur-carrier protein]-S-L-cysteine hydrolase
MESESSTGRIQLTTDTLDEVLRYAEAELPNEACGFLAGIGDRVEKFYPVGNEDRSQLTYLMEAKDRFRAEDDIERRGWRVIAIFHSHTHTQAYPSPTDRERAFWRDPVTGEATPIYPDVRYVIASLAPGEAPIRSFRIREDSVEDEDIETIESREVRTT